MPRAFISGIHSGATGIGDHMSVHKYRYTCWWRKGNPDPPWHRCKHSQNLVVTNLDVVYMPFTSNSNMSLYTWYAEVLQAKKLPVSSPACTKKGEFLLFSANKRKNSLLGPPVSTPPSPTNVTYTQCNDDHLNHGLQLCRVLCRTIIVVLRHNDTCTYYKHVCAWALTTEDQLVFVGENFFFRPSLSASNSK